MASYKTRDTKRHRYTYAERTVSAISDIRKHHPRSSIHLKTLEAQIRKNAQAQNDLLGPRWRTGVHMSCKSLTDEGILDSEHPPARIVLTPKGKQLLAKTRYSIGVSKDHENDSEYRESFGRKVISRLSVPPERSRPQGITRREDDKGKPPSKMTKAELFKENKRIREEFENLNFASTRKISELNKELEEREDELLDYRDRDLGFGDFEFNVGDVTRVQDASSEVQASRAGGTDEESSTRIQEEPTAPQSPEDGEAQNTENALSNRSLQRILSRNSDGLVRTKPGSFISGISKQPTPAPSDDGSDSPPETPGHDSMEVEDVFGNYGSESRREADTSFDPDVTLSDLNVNPTSKPKTGSAIRAGGQTLTPTSSPPRMSSMSRRFLSETVSRGDDLTRLGEEQVERLELIKELNDKGEALKERDMTIHQLKAQLRTLREQYNEAEGLRKNLEDEKANFQDSIDRLKTEIYEKSIGMGNLRELLQEKNREATDHARALDAEKDRANDLEAQLADVKKELLVSKGKTVEIGTELAQVMNKLQNEATERARLKSELASEHEQNSDLKSDMESLRSELNDVQKVLQTEQEGATALHESLREVVARLAELADQLEEKEAFLLETQGMLTQKEDELTTLQDQLASSDKLSMDFQKSLKSLETELRDSVAKNVLLQHTLQDAEEEVSEIKEGYKKLKKTHLAEYEEMDKRVSKKRRYQLST